MGFSIVEKLQSTVLENKELISVEWIRTILFYGIALAIIIYTFGLLASTADATLSPSLAKISDHLKISPPVAGATFLAFGNGAPDFFSGLASAKRENNSIPITADEKEKLVTGVGGTIGGIIFVSLVVTSRVILTHIACKRKKEIALREIYAPNSLTNGVQMSSPSGIARDLIFLWVGLFLFIVLNYKRAITRSGTLIFFLIYAIYVCCIIVQERSQRRRRRRKHLGIGAKEGQNASLVSVSLMNNSGSSGDSQEDLLDRTKDAVDSPPTANSLEPLKKKSSRKKRRSREYSPSEGGAETDLSELEQGSEAEDSPDITTSALIYDGAAASVSHAKGETENERLSIMEKEKRRDLRKLSTQTRDLSTWKRWKKTIKKKSNWAIEGAKERVERRITRLEWSDMSLFEKIQFVLSSPFLFMRWITTPNIEKIEKSQVSLLPLGLTIFLLALYGDIIGVDIFVPTTFVIVFLALSVVCYFLNLALVRLTDPETNELPSWIGSFLSYVAFVVSIQWISIFADFLLDAITDLSTNPSNEKSSSASYLSIGIILLALGNSVGDLVTNTAIAKKNESEMAITGCFAGPIFNLIIGLGSTLFCACHFSPEKSVELRIFNTVNVISVFIFAILIILSLLFLYLIFNRWNFDRRIAHGFMGAYGVLVALAIYNYFYPFGDLE